MTQADSQPQAVNPDSARAADIGLAMLMGAGLGDAMAVVQDTLATAQGAAARAFAGLVQIQAAGAAAASVPPVTRHVAAAQTQAEPDGPVEQSRAPVSQFAPSGPGPAAGVQQPITAPQDTATADVVAPVGAPDVRPLAPASLAPPPAPPQRPSMAPVLLAAFSPPPAAPMQAVGAERSIGNAAMPDPAPFGGRQRAPQPMAEPNWTSAAPTAWTGDAMSPVAPVIGQGSYAPASPVSAAPTAQTARGGPTAGDVFLDGARVGTWIADYLAHEAGRPQTGGTGFDPRLTPAWPGTLQGG